MKLASLEQSKREYTKAHAGQQLCNLVHKYGWKETVVHSKRKGLRIVLIGSWREFQAGGGGAGPKQLEAPQVSRHLENSDMQSAGRKFSKRLHNSRETGAIV